LSLFSPHGKQTEADTIQMTEDDTDNLIKHIGDHATQELQEELTMIREVYDPFNKEKYLTGDQSPVFFGSAVNNFGVREMLDCFVEIAPPPLARETEERTVVPLEKNFTGFVFKIHANIDPRHRDRIAFLRVVSGVFKRNTNYKHIRLEKSLKFPNPTSFMASRKSVVDEAYPGDIVGLYDSGNFKIGDSMTEGEELHFKGIPSFSPEEFRYITNANPMKRKQLDKGIDQLMDEGVAQLFTTMETNRKIIGTVGALQFDVIQYRLDHEYGATCTYEPLNLYKALWVECDDEKALDYFKSRRKRDLAIDKDDKLVYLADSSWALQMAKDNHPEVVFHEKSEF
jgi:peptide chain release factor 3